MTQSHRAGVVSGSIGFASRAVVQILLFGVTIVATRTMSIADFGAYSLATIFLILSRAMFYVGPYEYLLKAKDRPDLLRSCFSANLILACGAAVLLVMVHFIAPLLFDSHIVGHLVLLLAPTIVLVAVTAWYEAVLLRAMRVRRYYISTVAGDAFGAMVAVGLLLNGYGVLSLVAQAYARLAILLLLYIRATHERPGLFAPRAEVAKVLVWSRSRYAAVLLNFTSAYGADMVLGASVSPAATGIYRASNRIVSTLTDLFAQPLQKIAQTNLSAGFKRNEDTSQTWLTMLAGVGAFAWSGLLTLAMLAQHLIPFALGAKWAAAVPIVTVFCLVKAFSVIDAVTTSYLVCHDRQRDMLHIQIFAAVGVVLLAILAAPFGPLAVSMGVGAAMIAMSIALCALVLRHSRAGRTALANLVQTSLPPVVAVAVALVGVRAAAPELAQLPAIVAGLLAAAAAFLCASYFVRHRMLSAVGSLGHSRAVIAEAAE